MKPGSFRRFTVRQKGPVCIYATATCPEKQPVRSQIHLDIGIAPQRPQPPKAEVPIAVARCSRFEHRRLSNASRHLKLSTKSVWLESPKSRDRGGEAQADKRMTTFANYCPKAAGPFSTQSTDKRGSPKPNEGQILDRCGADGTSRTRRFAAGKAVRRTTGFRIAQNMSESLRVGRPQTCKL